MPSGGGVPGAAARETACRNAALVSVLRLVGRLRHDCALDNGLCFRVSGDQLLKGAVLDAVQLAEELRKG